MSDLGSRIGGQPPFDLGIWGQIRGQPPFCLRLPTGLNVCSSPNLLVMIWGSLKCAGRIHDIGNNSRTSI